MRNVLMITLLTGLTTTQAVAKPSLRDVSRVENGLFSIAVADKIREECDAISARMIKAYSELQALKSFARAQGYSEAEIKAYVKSPSEKNRMRAKRDAYLGEVGVVKSDPETYCAAGRAEIAKSSRIGALLRAR